MSCAVRYGLLNYIGEFRYGPGILHDCANKVVIQTNRGIEIGRRISLTCTGCENSIGRQRMLAYSQNSGADLYQPKAGRILRTATLQDIQEEERINAGTVLMVEQARKLAEAKRLQMKFVACEHLFGGERIIFHFMSEDRVDFRDIVRDLAHDYHTRIEMHQIGARDEARLVADYEICGRECCCKNFLKKLHPVTMRMAKLQKATLDPTKVSGRCGRLRCCLRYEHEGYEELVAKLPRPGARVRTERGLGTIRDRQILTQLLIVEYDDTGNLEAIGVEAILETGLPKRPPPEFSPGDNRSGPREDRGRGRGEREAVRGSGPQRNARPPRPEQRRGGAEDKRWARESPPMEPADETTVSPGDAEDWPAADRLPAETAAEASDLGGPSELPEDGVAGETSAQPPSEPGLPRRSKRRRRRGGRGRRGDRRPDNGAGPASSQGEKPA